MGRIPGYFRIDRIEGLTPQEYRVAVRLASGMSTKEAAWDLGVSSKTVEYLWNKIKAATGCVSKVDLVWYCLDHEMIAASGKPVQHLAMSEDFWKDIKKVFDKKPQP